MIIIKCEQINTIFFSFISGWDCHGLPVEYEIDKTLNIRGPEDVQRMGIAAYNNECRKIVMRYANEWEQVVNRMGRWIGKKYFIMTFIH